MKGRKPKPYKIKVLQGNPGKRDLTRERLKDSAFPSFTKPPRAPKHLSCEAKKEFRRLSTSLFKAGIIKETDIEALSCLSELLALFRTCLSELKKEGVIYKRESSVKAANPLLRAVISLSNTLRAYLIEFGMTPSSRERVSFFDTDTKTLEAIEMEKLLSGVWDREQANFSGWDPEES